jgi:heat shock protein HslJ
MWADPIRFITRSLIVQQENESMRNKILIASLVAAATLIAACVPVPPASTQGPAAPTSTGADNLAGTSWALTTLDGQPALKDTTVTLNFQDGKASGSDGCNNYSTSYTTDGTTFKIQQPIASTMMACPEPIMNQATAYMKVLEQAATYKADGKQLTLFDAGGKPTATFAAQSTDLAGSSWEVIGYNNGKQGVVSVALDTTLTADFGADGTLSGTAGCNNYTASYKTDGKTISIGPAATTRKMCAEPPNIMEQEMQYLQALSTAATYRIDGMKMEFRTAEGALAANFERTQ